MKPSHTIFVACALVALSLSADGPQSGRPADLDDLAFTAVKGASVAKLNGISLSGRGFHNYNVVSEWRILDGDSAREIGNLLRDRISQQLALLAGAGIYNTGVVLAPFCFDPGYAVHLETDKGRRDFVICLKCTYIYGYDAKGTELGMDPDSGMLTKLKACYLDEFVLDEGVQKQP
jgi:hypothetical protein